MPRRHPDILGMKRYIAAMMIMTATMASAPHHAIAQIIGPGASPSLLPPPPPAPPPPRNEIAPIPQLNAPLAAPRPNLEQRGSFSDRVGRCLDYGASQGLGPNERSEYSRACAN